MTHVHIQWFLQIVLFKKPVSFITIIKFRSNDFQQLQALEIHLLQIHASKDTTNSVTL